jgi:phosphoribosylanthranilate isomerase
MALRVKICGITDVAQGKEIAAIGASALGFICVPSSPRYVTASRIGEIVAALPSDVAKIGVFANADWETIVETASIANLTGIQLHGDESWEYIDRLKQILPDQETIKVCRPKTIEDLRLLNTYASLVDTFLIDAYHPQQLGGTGQTADWQMLADFHPQRPWLLAGGLTPDNVVAALSQLHPDGIDLSSGVENSPGNKDLAKVTALFANLATFQEDDRQANAVVL